MKSTIKDPKKIFPIKIVKKKELKSAKPATSKVVDFQRMVHLLQVNQIELEHQNQELRIAEQELEISRNKYVNLFDFSPIPYFTLNLNGFIKEVNLNGAKMCGDDRRKIVGKSFKGFIAIEDKENYDNFIVSVFTSSKKQTCKLKMINKEKKCFFVQLEGVKYDDTLETGAECQIALLDLSEFKKLEDSVRNLSEQLKVSQDF